MHKLNLIVGKNAPLGKISTKRTEKSHKFTRFNRAVKLKTKFKEKKTVHVQRCIQLENIKRVGTLVPQPALNINTQEYFSYC